MKAPGFWQRDKGGLYAALLTPFAWAYGAAAWARYMSKKTWKADIPVICIGNIVAGGAGKTPVALAIAKKLIDRKYAVHFLTRGYGGAAGHDDQPVRVDPARHSAREVGDEALMLAATAATWVAGDRAAGARTAIDDGAQAVVMDDGFQNPSLAKDFSLLVVDGDFGFGNGQLLPAGPLREPVACGMARAGAVAVIGGGEASRGAIIDDIQKMGKAVIRGRLEPDARTAALLAGKKVAAFAGIGRPEKFFKTLAGLGCQLTGARAFADHHPFTDEEIESLKALAARSGALLMTTEKDYQRLSGDQRKGVGVLRVSVSWENEADLDRILGKALASGEKAGQKNG